MISRYILAPLTVRPAGPWLLLAVVVALAGCSNHLDTSAVEATIKADIERQGRRLALREVRCPQNIARQAGAYFRCVGELDTEGIFTINVTQQDSQGTVTWDVPNSKVLLNLAKLEASLQQGLGQALGQRALVDCGEALYRVNQPGDRFECQVVGGITDGASLIPSILVKVDASGNLDWQELRINHSELMAANPNTGPGPSSHSSLMGNPAAAAPPRQNAPNPSAGSAALTTTTGPTGRVINRPYLPGDND